MPKKRTAKLEDVSKRLTPMDIMTERMIALTQKAIDEGTPPFWRKPWTCTEHRSAIYGNEYNGINPWLLDAAGFGTCWWATWNGWTQIGGTIKEGQGKLWTPVFLSKKIPTGEKDEEGNELFRWMHRYYSQYNLEQVDLPEECYTSHMKKVVEKREFVPIEEAERLFALYKNAPKVTHGGNRAYYRIVEDSIGMPKKSAFKSPEFYYATLFHECGHSTGHASRLNRKGIAKDRNEEHSYDQEELVAELAASILCGKANIDQEEITENQVEYLKSWMRAFSDNPKMLHFAALDAAKAARHIIGEAEKVYTKPVKEEELAA
jgi:antirestriction protein ArdC